MHWLAIPLGALSLLTAVNTAAALEFRSYPSKQLYSYELDAAHGLRSVVLQNVALINDDETDVTLSRVDLELTAVGVAHETRTVHAAELERTATANSQLQRSGMLKVLAFQFGGQTLLPDGVTLASTRVLKPGEALLLTQQVLTFSGTRDALRIRVQTPAGTSEMTLPVSIEPSRTAFVLPLQGTWHDGAGPSLHTHHRWVVPQEFAHDFTRIGANGLAYRTEGTRLSDYYAYDQPVLAAATGQISAVVNDEPEDATLLQRAGEPMEIYLQRIVERQNAQLMRGARGISGNHVLIKHGEEYSLYAHLKPGSVKVKVGDRVSQGQQIASVGSSGSSTEPHLHFHVCDAQDVLLCAGIPARFEDVEIYGALQPRQLQSGDLVRNRSKHRQ
jgi:murein DD-endopeptidase MepM/ murein hydrolase activator NlpD